MITNIILCILCILCSHCINCNPYGVKKSDTLGKTQSLHDIKPVYPVYEQSDNSHPKRTLNNDESTIEESGEPVEKKKSYTTNHNAYYGNEKRDNKPYIERNMCKNNGSKYLVINPYDCRSFYYCDYFQKAFIQMLLYSTYQRKRGNKKYNDLYVSMLRA